MSALSPRKEELLDRVEDVFARSKNVDFMVPEDTGYFSINDVVVREVRAVMHETADLMGRIMDCYEDEPGGHPEPLIDARDDTEFLKEIGAQISSTLAVEEVSGLAFISRNQLLDMLDDLDQAVASCLIWKVASCADSGLRRAGRALVAIESAMRECEGLPARYRQWQNLDDSLEVRRIYGELRRAVLRDEDPDATPPPAELASRLAEAAEQIAILRSREIYPYLRIDDRLQIRRLQKRIQTWQEGTRATREGTQLWSDLASFARLLAAVNLRQELREHDRLAVSGLWRRFFPEKGAGPGRTGDSLTPSDLALLEPLVGLDDELDAVILQPEKHVRKDLRLPLERLRQSLGSPFDRAPYDDFLAPAGAGE